MARRNEKYTPEMIELGLIKEISLERFEVRYYH